MDDPQAAFASQYQQYTIDIDMMKVRHFSLSLLFSWLSLAVLASIRQLQPWTFSELALAS